MHMRTRNDLGGRVVLGHITEQEQRQQAAHPAVHIHPVLAVHIIAAVNVPPGVARIGSPGKSDRDRAAHAWPLSPATRPQQLVIDFLQVGRRARSRKHGPFGTVNARYRVTPTRRVVEINAASPHLMRNYLVTCVDRCGVDRASNDGEAIRLEIGDQRVHEKGPTLQNGCCFARVAALIWPVFSMSVPTRTMRVPFCKRLEGETRTRFRPVRWCGHCIFGYQSSGIALGCSVSMSLMTAARWIHLASMYLKHQDFFRIR